MKVLFEYERWARLVKTLRMKLLFLPALVAIYSVIPYDIIGQAALFSLGIMFMVCIIVFAGVLEQKPVVYQIIPPTPARNGKAEKSYTRFPPTSNKARTHFGTQTVH